MREGIIIPYDNIPKKFCVHSTFFKVYKEQEKKKQQGTLTI